MKHPISNAALIAASVSIIGKMVYHLFLQEWADADMYTRFFYLLCFLISLFAGLRWYKLQHPQSAFTDDIKAGMKVASIYAIVISGFTYVYYAFINPAYFAERIAERVSNAEEVGATAEQVQQVNDTASFIFDPFTHSTLTLFGYIAIGLFYTIILVMLFRGKPRAFGI